MNENQFVYLMVQPCSNLVKIGFSKNPIQRKNDLSRSTSTPYRFSVHCAWLVDDMRFVEKMLHQHYAYCRVNDRREFFDPSDFHEFDIPNNMFAGVMAANFLSQDICNILNANGIKYTMLYESQLESYLGM